MATKEALGMSLEISQEYIEKLTKDLLTESLIETLDAKNRIVESIVSEVLSVKVDKDGRPSTYNGDSHRTYLKYLCEKMIRDELNSVAEEVMTERRTEIRGEIKKAIVKKANMDKFVDAFINTALNGLNCTWKTNVNFTFTKESD